MESTVTVLWLSTLRLQVLNDLSPVTWVHHAVLIWDQNPHNLTFAINRSVCHALKYQKLVEKIPLEEEMATHSTIVAWSIPLDRGAWQATVHRIAKSQTQLKQFSMHGTKIG